MCVRLPAQRAKTVAEGVDAFDDDRSLTALANRLVERRVQRVVMEATPDYWEPVLYLLEARLRPAEWRLSVSRGGWRR